MFNGKKLGTVAAVAVAAACASSHKDAKPGSLVQIDFVPDGGHIGETEMLTPPEAFKTEEEVKDAIEITRGKIYRAGGRAAEERAVANCDKGITGTLCEMEEGLHTIQGLNLYSKAITTCYSGPVTPSGGIDPNGSGTIDLECLLKLSPAPEKIEAEHLVKMLACRRNVLQCFQDEYRSLNRAGAQISSN